MPALLQLKNENKVPAFWKREIYVLFHKTLGNAKRLIMATDDYFDNPFDSNNVERLKGLVTRFSLTEQEFKEIVFWRSIMEEERDRRELPQIRARRRWELN